MTNTPNPDNEPESNQQPELTPPTPPPRRRRRRLWFSLTGILLVGIGGGLTWGWIFLHQKLSPLVEKQLIQVLGRPIDLGELESVGLGGLEFGPTSVPATADDPDSASVEAVQVRFNNLFKLLTNRELLLDVVLVEPELYAEQDEKGIWINLPPNSDEEAGPIKTEIERVSFRDADVTLVPRSKQGKLYKPIELLVDSGGVELLDEGRHLVFQLAGDFLSSGDFRLRGEFFTKTKRAKLRTRAKKLNALEIGRLLPLPFELRKGKLDANLRAEINGKKPLLLNGIVDVENVTVALEQLPQTLAKTNGRLIAKGTEIKLKNISTVFGQVAAKAGGLIDLDEGLNIKAATLPVEITKVFTTFGLKKTPVPFKGQIRADLAITGPFDKPKVNVKARGIKTIQVDKLRFRNFSALLELVGSNLKIQNFEVLPLVGGKIQATGNVNLKEGGNLAIDADATGVSAEAISQIYGLDLPVTLGLVAGNAKLFGPWKNLANLQADINGNLNLAGGIVAARDIKVRDGRWAGLVRTSGLKLNQIVTEITGKSLPLFRQSNLNGLFNVSGSVNKINLQTITARGSAQTNLAGQNVAINNILLNKGRWQGRIQASDVQISRLIELPPQIPGGQLESVLLNVSGSLSDFSPESILATGTANLRAVGGRISVSDIALQRGNWSSTARVSDLDLARIVPLPAQFRLGELDGIFNLAGNINSLNLNSVRARGTANFGLAGGRVVANDVRVARGRWQSNVAARGIRVRNLASVPRQFQGIVNSDLNLFGSLNNLSLAGVNGGGSGNVVLPNGAGVINASQINLADNRWQARGLTQNLQIAKLVPQISQLQGSAFTGNFNLNGTLASFTPDTIQGKVKGNLNNFRGGRVVADADLKNGNWFADLDVAGVNLALLNQDLAGNVGGDIQARGNLANLTPAGIRAKGDLNFNQGLALIDRPLAASFNWTGKRLQIPNATAEDFVASGYADLDLANSGLNIIERYDFKVDTENLNLAKLPIPLPEAAANLALGGLADFDGRIAGTIKSPNINGGIALRNFIFDGLDFDPLLAGSVTSQDSGINLQLNGEDDIIRVALAPNYQPNSFYIRFDQNVAVRFEEDDFVEVTATGTRRGDILDIDTENFPISIAKEFIPLPPQLATQTLAGQLSGNIAVNLKTFAISGDIAIARPIVGNFEGDLFTGRFNYANGFGVFNEGELRKGESIYALDARLSPGISGPEIVAKADVEKGRIEDVLYALQIFDLEDLTRGSGDRNYGNQEDIGILSLGLPGTTVETQLQRLAEVQTLLQQQRLAREDASPLPELEKLEGEFSGSVDVAASIRNSSLASLQAEFDFLGDDWQWEEYLAERVVAKGSINSQGSISNTRVTLQPVLIELANNGALAFTGNLGEENLSGQLRAKQVPVSLIQEFVELPPAIGFGGLVDAQASISGSRENPQSIGTIEIVDAKINQQSVQKAEGSFQYNDAILNFAANAILAGSPDNPLTVNGKIPYQLPGTTVEPASNELALAVKVKDDGLAILDILTRQQLGWVAGKGDVDINIKGIFDQKLGRPENLVVDGSAIISDATISSELLTETLTDVDGEIIFDFDTIEVVNTLTGKYGGGEVVVSGSLPISQPSPQESPLTIALKELDFNLKGIYQGGVGGEVLITRTALSPLVSGEINLKDGKVFIAESSNLDGGSGEDAGAGEGVAGDNNNQEAGITPEFANLKINLVDDIQITQPPILNFSAKGDFTLNGPLDDPRPDGLITLERGQVNLFTTQFRLRGGYPQTAEFRPELGLDPILNVQLIANVSEGTPVFIPTDTNPNEIPDAPISTFGSLQSVRVIASVEGAASRLDENLELSSNPRRSETEIVALLGGSVLNSFSQDAAVGLANLAGTALLGNFQRAVGDTLGLSEFRLFPTSSASNSQGGGSEIGVGAEAAFDISRDLSVSVIKVLTDERPAQYGLRYRIDDNTLFRGSTDFQGDSRAVVEYEFRF
ncbi:MAG: translocation/assembly module TamB domain-containing protein [Spirulinaceae cyanobacterium]